MQKEIDCKCRDVDCVWTWLNTKAIHKFEATRELFGKRIRVNRMFSCYEHNINVGGTRFSRHPLGQAFDLAPMEGYLIDLVKACRMAGWDYVKPYPNHVHVHMEVPEYKYEPIGKSDESGTV